MSDKGQERGASDEFVHTNLRDVYGPVHTGSGDINITHASHSVRPPILSEADRAAILADYKRWQCHQFASLPLSGIPTPMDVAFSLDEVYIKLRALPQRARQREHDESKDSVTIEDAISFVRRFGELQWQRFQETDARNTLAGYRSLDPVSPEQAITLHAATVIIGVPGSGKSTLLRHMVWEKARIHDSSTTVFTALGRLDSAMSRGESSMLQVALSLATEHTIGERQIQLQTALEAAIGRKDVLFFFDGLDEVHACRHEIVNALEALAADGHRIVVTSRPIGYERLLGFEHFEVLPLDANDATSFSKRWFQALAVARAVPPDDRETWVADRGAWLHDQLSNRASIRELARVPLMLTFLVMLAGDDPREDLPRYRKTVYRRFVERLLTTWEARRKKDGVIKLADVAGDEAQAWALWALYETAYILHSSYYGDQSPIRPTPENVERQLASLIPPSWSGIGPAGTARISRILRFWEEAGLLLRYKTQDDEFIAFRHLTFQEYGACRALAERDRETRWQLIQRHLTTPQWGEVIPLTLSHLAQDESTRVVELLLEADRTDGDFHRPILYACNALADGAPVHQPTRHSVIDKILELARNRPLWTVEGASATSMFNVLAELQGDTYCGTALIAVAHDVHVHLLYRVVAVEAAGRIGYLDAAVGVLLAASELKHTDPSYQLFIARTMGRLGLRNEAREIMRRHVIYNLRPSIRGATAEVQAELGEIDDAAQTLKDMVDDPLASSPIRLEALRGLLRLKKVETAMSLAKALLADRLADDKLRAQLLILFGHLPLPDSLESLLRTTRSSDAKLLAIEGLGRDYRPSECISVLESIAAHHEEVLRVRLHAVRLIGRYRGNDQAVTVLLKFASDPFITNLFHKTLWASLASVGLPQEADRLKEFHDHESATMAFTDHLKELLRYLVVPTFILLAASFAADRYFRIVVIPGLAYLYGQVGVERFAASISSASRLMKFDLSFLVTWPVIVISVYLFVRPGLLGNAEKAFARRLMLLGFGLPFLAAPVIVALLSRLTSNHPLNLSFTNRLALSLTFALGYLLAPKLSSIGIRLGRFSRWKFIVLLGAIVLTGLLPISVWPMLLTGALGLAFSGLTVIMAWTLLKRKRTSGLSFRAKWGSLLALQRRPLLRKMGRAQIRATIAYDEMLDELGKIAQNQDLPSDIRWSLLELDEENYDMVMAVEFARQVASDPHERVWMRIWAAKSLARLLSVDEVDALLSCILSDHGRRLNVRLRVARQRKRLAFAQQRRTTV